MADGGCIGDREWAAFCDGRLEEELAARVRRHVAACEACALRAGMTGDTQETERDGSRAASVRLRAPIELAASARLLTRGAKIGRYLVLDTLGAGGVGVVYAAYDPELDRKVAVKVLRPELGDDGAVEPLPRGDASSPPSSRGRWHTRMMREAQAMAKLSHPNVVAVHDVGMLGDRVFIAMELVPAGTVKRWLRADKRSIREVVEVYRAAGRGLAAAHAAGLVHRDFKPDNVLIGDDGRVRVTDFGLARAETTRDAEALPLPPPDQELPSSPVLDAPLTRVGAVMGTPGYMAPEQYRALPVDARTDQFAFCASLYEGLYGERPFRGKTLAEVEDAVLDGDVAEAPVDARVPAWMRKVLLRGLSVDPAARYASMDALLTALAEDPDRARKRRARVVVLASIVALAASFLVRGARREGLVCQGADRKLAGIWDDARRSDVTRAFAATAKPFAARAGLEVTRAIDAYAGAWVAMHTDACEATRVRGEQAEDVLTARMVCLESRRRDLAALVDLFAHADADVVARAVQAARALPAIDVCADLPSMTAAAKTRVAPDVEAKLAPLRTRLADARALLVAGKYEAGVHVAQGVRDEVSAAGDADLAAELLGILGRLEVEASDFTAARDVLHAAIDAAEEARRDDLKAASARELAYVVTQRTRSYDEAHRWLDFAAATTRRLGAPNAMASALVSARARLFLAEGKYTDAEREARAGVPLAEATFGREALDVGEAHQVLGDALKQVGKYAEAYDALERARRIDEAALGPDHPLVGRVIEREVALFNLANDAEKAVEHGTRALAILEKALTPMDLAVGDAHNALAVAYDHSHRYDEAIAEEQHALDTYVHVFGADSSDAAMSYGNLSAYFLNAHRHAEAEDYARRSLAIYERTMSGHPQLAIPLANLGETLLATSRPAAAVPPLERALALREGDAEPCQALTTIEILLARALWNANADRRRAITLARRAAEQTRTCVHGDKADEIAAFLAAHDRR